MDSRIAATTVLRDKLMTGLETDIPKIHINGDRVKRLREMFTSVSRQSRVNRCCSALLVRDYGCLRFLVCRQGSQSSHVLAAIGCNPALANASILLSLGFENTMAEVDKVIEVLPPIIEKLRAMSPIWNG